MTNREAFIGALAQTLAPKLFEASGDAVGAFKALRTDLVEA